MTVAEDPQACTLHLRDARAYLEDAEVAYAAGRHKPSASNACIATIRAADAVCVAELGQRWSGQHAGGTALVRQTSLGDRGAVLLGEATAAKNVQQYRTVETTPETAASLVEGARELLGAAEKAVARAGYPIR